MSRRLAYLRRTVALIAVSLNSLLYAQVEINELSASVSTWRLKWDATGHPSVGQGPAWWLDGFSSVVPWAESAAPFGWGSQRVETNLQATMQSVTPSLYLRREFVVSQEVLEGSGELNLELDYDDGVIVWINGMEIARRNMGPPQMHVYRDQLAMNPSSAGEPESLNLGIASELLEAGTNLIAVQVGNYSLDSNLFFDAALTVSGSGTLFQYGAGWEYFVGHIEPSGVLYEPAFLPDFSGTTLGWTTLSFDEGGWKTSNGPLGYDAGDDYVLGKNLLSEMRMVTASLYMRQTFQFETSDDHETSDVVLTVDYDDGFIAYLNGTEIVRRNLGTKGKFQPYTATAEGEHSASMDAGGNRPASIEVFALDRSLLREGTNVLSAQLHNSTAYSTDLLLSMELKTVGIESKVIAPSDGEVQYFVGTTEPSPPPTAPATIPKPEFVDWLELHNSALMAVDLAGWSVTDDPMMPRKFVFPRGTRIEGNGYLVVAADDHEEQNGRATLLHANFKLSSGGESVSLFDSEGEVVSVLFPDYPKQNVFYSYGREPGGETFGFLAEPTPGAANKGLFSSAKADSPQFSVGGGFHAEPVELALTSDTLGVTIRYTMDGSDPTMTSGELYTAPFVLDRIDEKTGHCIRAQAFRDGLLDSDISTQTYLIGQHPDLSTAPTLIMSGESENVFYKPYGVLSIEGGKYVNDVWIPERHDDYHLPRNRGRAYERPGHIEFYEPDGSGFHGPAGIRVSASGYSRPRLIYGDTQASPFPPNFLHKPSFNLWFRNDYGQSNVKYPLLGDDYPVRSFEQFRVRAGKNDARNPFIRDELVRRLYHDMGQESSLGRINTLYINGRFKGFYNLCERLREPFMQKHHDSEEEWDVRQVRSIENGDGLAWNELKARLAQDLDVEDNWEAVLEYIDPIAIADYYLLNIYAATWDWPNNNWVAARERSADGRFRFYVWDAEGGFGLYGEKPVDYNILESNLLAQSDENSRVFQDLLKSAEWRLLFADRVHKHMFNGGAIDDRDLEGSIIRARKDALVSSFQPLLRYVHGLTVGEVWYDKWVDPAEGRRTYLLGPNSQHLRDNDLWPATQVPVFNQLGGEVESSFVLTMSASDQSTVWFTLDGSDPRAFGGGLGPTASEYSNGLTLDQPVVSVRARSLSIDGEWSPLAEAVFRVGLVAPTSSTIAITEFMYRPVAPSEEEIQNGYTDAEEFEFIRLQNTGAESLDLRELRFDDGIEFEFGEGDVTELLPGASVVVVKDVLAFQFRHGRNYDDLIAGEYSGKLANQGDDIRLVDAEGTPLQHFRYEGTAPWPEPSEELGQSLNLVNSASDLSDPDNWVLASEVLADALVTEETQILINEFMASNVSIGPDNVDYDDYSDWIELRNVSNRTANLDDFYLSDDPAQPFLWRFPEGASIPPNGYLVVRADGFDASPGETDTRAFSPWNLFTVSRYHTNFKLSSAGEAIVLAQGEGNVDDATLVPLGATWKYLDDGSDPGNEWATVDFDDRDWPSGVAQLGYGDDDEDTTIGFGGNATEKFPASYFRTTFSVAKQRYSGVILRLLADDGAVVYLNGREIARIRMPFGQPTFETFAARGATDGVFETFEIAPDDLRDGVNTLAVEVHQFTAGSSDLSFDLELTVIGERDTGVIVDEIVFGPQRPNVSYGRRLDDPDEWAFFGEPTINAANTTITTEEPVPSSDVSISPAGGFFEEGPSVVLETSLPGASIHYTIDGSVPRTTSPVYLDPITLNETTVVRAQSFAPGHVPSSLSTQTYFVNEGESSLPTVSVVVEPKEFFDPTIGIYSNVHKGREAAGTISFYEQSQELGFQVNAGIKIGGENIWRFAQKPLNVKLRGKYGDDLIPYKVFPNDSRSLFQEIGFRNGGDNWANSMLRDAMAPFIVQGQLDCDVANYRPVSLYLNGSYWGIHNLRARHGDHYYFTEYQIQPGEYDLLTRERGPEGVHLVAKSGSDTEFLALEELARTTDLRDEQNYAAVAEQIDLDSLMDYLAMVDFVHEISYIHNQEFWRDHRPGSKWQWAINDIDRGLDLRHIADQRIHSFHFNHPLFANLIVNTGFRNRFVQRYAAHMSSTFHPERLKAIVERLAVEVDGELPRHIERWASEGGIPSLESRDREVAEIKQFADERADKVFAYMAERLGFPASTSTVTINQSPEGGGKVRINGVPMLPEYSESVRLYDNISFELAADASPGFRFVGWSTGDNEAVFTHTLTGDMAITAMFARSDEMIVPSVVETNLTLSANSPYVAEGDIVVKAGATLTVPKGITLRMPVGASIYVEGGLRINGTAAEPVTIEPRVGSELWGAIAFVRADGPSVLSHLRIRGASLASADPVNLKASVSNFHSDLTLEHVDIDVLFPVFARGGRTVMRFCRVHPQFTGDGINVKSGEGLVEYCTFVGNDSPDTDAIDFDNVVDGVIRGNRIFAFRGFNSDGIDVGEGCVNLMVSGNRIYNCSDKGVSVGQGSETYIERNLIVDCVLGVGVKDTGSRAFIDQNTFALNGTAVAVFEKNLDSGGGQVFMTNSIIYRPKNAPVTFDDKSLLTVSYSLSDSLPLEGIGNVVADPMFQDPTIYNFALKPASSAIDSGDPTHQLDEDGTRADRGAYYVYDPADYPYQTPNSIVINEVLSHSHAGERDWIELYNSSGVPVDVGGWYLSDDGDELQKYRIAEDTVIPPDGYLVFYEDETFGEASTDANRLAPFALSENGGSIYLYGPGDSLFLDYLEDETFGPSLTGVSRGRYEKSTNTQNFVPLKTPTPGAVNSDPRVGPLVISEIMYHPQTDGSSEYIELTNISDSNVVLYDELKNEGWRVTQGITFDFPVDPPVTVAPGEFIILVRNLSAFDPQFSVPDGTQVFQWTGGGLSNGGERIEISSPGDTDSDGVRKWIRIDRVNYSDNDLWPEAADGGGLALGRIALDEYGNDVINWKAERPSPGWPGGQHGFVGWANSFGVNSFDEDDDGDGLQNGLEYALESNPHERRSFTAIEFDLVGGEWEFRISLPEFKPDLDYQFESSVDAKEWFPIETRMVGMAPVAVTGSVDSSESTIGFVRLRIDRR
ncbi:lamin tail domain-containing protein [bacterium]|nr:lamin tail domain-containing protein [bacterium]